MNGITIYEFDALASERPDAANIADLPTVPEEVFEWLETQCLRTAEAGDAAWLKLTQRQGRRTVQVKSYVGVIRAPSGYQIEVLPKVGKAIGGGMAEARRLLIEMLCCLPGFRHIQTDSAKLAAARMPLLEVFIAEFLRAVEHIVKRGLRSDYTGSLGNLHALRGKLLTASHLRHNLVRADRFFTEHDEFSINRPENRLIHAALRSTLAVTRSQGNQQLARELTFAFADVPPSSEQRTDFQRLRLDRGMTYYADALAWTRLILEEESPLTGAKDHVAPSLLFPMEAVFEAFVAKHLTRQLPRPLTLKTQPRRHHLVRHQGQGWFQLKPDLLIRNGDSNLVVLDTKWKLLDGAKANSTNKYVSAPRTPSFPGSRRCDQLLSVEIPRQEGLEVFDGGGGGQAAQHVTQPQVRLNVVGLGGLDQRVEQRAGTRTGLGVGEEPRFPPNDEGANGVFGGIVVDRQVAAFEVARQSRPLPMQVAQRATQHRGGRYGGEQLVEPAAQFVEDGAASALA